MSKTKHNRRTSNIHRKTTKMQAEPKDAYCARFTGNAEYS